jgi:hypothetical protein
MRTSVTVQQEQRGQCSLRVGVVVASGRGLGWVGLVAVCAYHVAQPSSCRRSSFSCRSLPGAVAWTAARGPQQPGIKLTGEMIANGVVTRYGNNAGDTLISVVAAHTYTYPRTPHISMAILLLPPSATQPVWAQKNPGNNTGEAVGSHSEAVVDGEERVK